MEKSNDSKHRFDGLKLGIIRNEEHFNELWAVEISKPQPIFEILAGLLHVGLKIPHSSNTMIESICGSPTDTRTGCKEFTHKHDRSTVY